MTGQAIDAGEASELFGSPISLLVTTIVVLFLGPVPEEIGWRGFLLDRFQLRWGAVTASILVGIVWLVWHAPLFVMAGYYDAVGGSPDLFPFATGIVITSVLYTWVHNNARRSVFATIVFHFMQNFVGQVLAPTPTTRSVQAVLFILVVALVVVLWGPTHLRRNGSRPVPVAGSFHRE